MTPDDLNIIPRIEQIGSADIDGYAVDFNSAVIGSPYITSTGYLPTIEEAVRVAGVILFVIDVLALATLHAHPDVAGSWADPEGEALQSWATIVSAAREGGSEDGDPVVEERYDRDDDRFTLDINLHGFTLTDEESECLQAVVDEANQRLHRLFSEEGIVVTIARRADAVDLTCSRPYRRERLGRHTSIGLRHTALNASDEAIIRAVYGDQHIFDAGPPPVVEVEAIGDARYRVKVTA